MAIPSVDDDRLSEIVKDLLETGSALPSEGESGRSLCFASIGLPGAKILAEALAISRNRDLHSLIFLTNNLLGDEGIERLCNVLQGHPVSRGIISCGMDIRFTGSVNCSRESGQGCEGCFL